MTQPLNKTEPRIAELRRRVDKGYRDFQNTMLFERSKKAIFFYAPRIAAYQKAHRLLTTRESYSEMQLNVLLSLDDPLRFMADKCYNALNNIMGESMSDAIKNLQ